MKERAGCVRCGRLCPALVLTEKTNPAPCGERETRVPDTCACVSTGGGGLESQPGFENTGLG